MWLLGGDVLRRAIFTCMPGKLPPVESPAVLSCCIRSVIKSALKFLTNIFLVPIWNTTRQFVALSCPNNVAPRFFPASTLMRKTNRALMEHSASGAMLLTAGCWFSWLSPQPWTCRPAVRRIAALRHPTRVLGRGGQSNDAPGFSAHRLRAAHRRGCLRGDSVRSDFSGAPGLSSRKPF